MENNVHVVKIKLYNEIKTIDVEPDESILQAAFRAGLDPPFSCQVGVCGSCMAKLESGKVLMDERDALTDEEIEKGFILTCQSHPQDDDCYVNYDY
ncbi:MAG: 2Fe-2S iron-sulfur cluster-binding protein [Candidatus Kapaibacteriota bacterium]